LAGRCSVICFASSANVARTCLSRNRHPFGSVPDGEMVAVDRRGKPRFNDLLFRCRSPCFFAFDLLTLDGRDGRTHQLTERKPKLRRLLARVPRDCPLRYVDHVDGSGIALFDRVCKLDLEGIVAKHKFGPHVEGREQSTWVKNLQPQLFPEARTGRII
jgi:bifunctional non-homologous end joining protein LigD